MSQPISSTLGKLESQLKMRIDTACKGITQGDNRFVELEDKAGELKWSVPVKKSRESINNPFFDQLPLTSIISNETLPARLLSSGAPTGSTPGRRLLNVRTRKG